MPHLRHFFMKFYWIKTNALIRALFRKYVWKMPHDGKTVYLTFDDGPVAECTPWVLDQLAQYNYKATFFCIGNNIEQHPGLLQRIIREGHSVGNHTQHHVNGWKTPTDVYLSEVKKCNDALSVFGIKSALFRPPYGKLTRVQRNKLLGMGFQIIMWDILSADFDSRVTPPACTNNVLRHLKPGSIVIFHDSVKAWPNLKVALPATLKAIKEKGYQSAAL